MLAVTYAERVTAAELVGTPHGRRPVVDKGPPDEHVPYPATATAAAFRTATQLFLDQLKQFTDMTQAAGTTPWTDTAGPPGTELAREVLEHMRSMAEHTPAPTAHLDTFLQELRAKRALIGGSADAAHRIRATDGHFGTGAEAAARVGPGMVHRAASHHRYVRSPDDQLDP